jgi:PAS domain S-box-containing protein
MEGGSDDGVDRRLARLGGPDAASLRDRAEQLGGTGTLVWDATADRVALSAGAARLLGFPPAAEPSIEGVVAALHADDRDRLRALVRERSNDRRHVEVRVAGAPQGSQGCRLRLDWDEVPDAQGNRAGAVGILLDVSERLSAREALHHSEALWLSVGMNPDDLVVLVDRRGVFQWVNHTVAGIRMEDLIGKASILDFVGPEDYPVVEGALATCFERGLPSSFEVYSPQIGRWYASSLGPVFRDGPTEVVSIVTRDVTDAHRMVAELRRRERMLAEAQQIAGVGSWHHDAATGAIEWSAELYRILGVDPSLTPTRQLYHSHIHEDDRARVAAIACNPGPGGGVEPHEYRIRRSSDGALRYVLATGKPLVGPEGTVTGFLGTSLDITDRRELEADLAQSRKLEAVGRLAGGIAHDFNNVLTAILGNAEFAARELPRGSPASASLEVIRAAAERASHLTRQLLTFARRQIVAPRVSAPNALITSVASLLRPLLGDDVRLELVLPETTWLIRVDVGQFEQLLMNLAVNARDAMPTGGTLRVETRNVRVAAGTVPHPEVAPGEYVALSVTDTGQGIPLDVQAHVFEPFFTTKATGRGTGLGLATCHGIVKQNGGHIWLESTPGIGTRAHTYLPRASPEAAEQPVETPPALRTGSETILVLEDEPLVRGLVIRSLQALGYRILEAANGAAALSAAASCEGPIDLLFADVVLPDRRGTEVAAALAATHPETRVLYTSGYTEDHAVTGGVIAASVRFLHKPYTVAALAAAVRAALDEPRPPTSVRTTSSPTA